jgi:hypothetical protein
MEGRKEGSMRGGDMGSGRTLVHVFVRGVGVEVEYLSRFVEGKNWVVGWTEVARGGVHTYI